MAFHTSHTRSTRLRLVLAGAFGLILATAALSIPNHAAAQDDSLKDTSYHVRPQMLSFFTGFHYGYFSGYGVPWQIGARYYIPIMHDGFLPNVNDEFGVEFGLDFIFSFLSDYNYYRWGRGSDDVMFAFGVPADAVWDFHFSPRFDAYAKVGFVLGGIVNTYADGVWGTFHTGVGLRFKLNDVLNLRAEVGYPSVIVGLGIAL